MDIVGRPISLHLQPKTALNRHFYALSDRHQHLLNVSVKKAELEDRNVLFMEDGGAVYLKKLFDRAVVTI